MPSTFCMRMVWPCMSIWWISARPATGDWTSTRRVALGERSCMKAPAVFWAGTVARIHGSVTVTWADAALAKRLAAASTRNLRYMALPDR